MTSGERIKKYRLLRELSQKQVALRAGMSEPAIRNYELGNRTPSEKQIEKIALALSVSPFAISDPNLDIHNSVMHALFYLEEKYGLIPEDTGSSLILKLDDVTSPLYGHLASWIRAYQKYQKSSADNDANAKISYEEWKCMYPQSDAKINTQLLNDAIRKNKK